MEAISIYPTGVEGEQEQLPGLYIDSDGYAEWCLRKRKEYIDIYMAEAEHHMRQTALAKERCDRLIAPLTDALRNYLNRVPAHETKTQRSYCLPSGKLTLEQQQPKYEQDNAALSAFLIGAGMTDYVEHVVPEPYYKALWGTLKPLTQTLDDGTVVIKETGEVVTGVTAQMREPVFEIGG